MHRDSCEKQLALHEISAPPRPASGTPRKEKGGEDPALSVLKKSFRPAESSFLNFKKFKKLLD